jgi:hypothetical protein
LRQSHAWISKAGGPTSVGLFVQVFRNTAPALCAAGNLGLLDDPLIDRLRTHEIITDWDPYLADEEDATAIEGLRSQTGTGRPDGDDEFLKLLESQTGRRVRKRRAGRKKK